MTFHLLTRLSVPLRSAVVAAGAVDTESLPSVNRAQHMPAVRAARPRHNGGGLRSSMRLSRPVPFVVIEIDAPSTTAELSRLSRRDRPARAVHPASGYRGSTTPLLEVLMGSVTYDVCSGS